MEICECKKKWGESPYWHSFKYIGKVVTQYSS
jgi:hypothetical protein